MTGAARRAVLTACLAVSAVALPRDALAYCRTTVCGPDQQGARCTPAQDTDCGLPLFWPTSCVGYSMQRDASARLDLETATAVTRAAFDTWQAADCGAGARPSVQMFDLGPVDCAAQGYDPEQKNANIVLFRDASWPYDSGALALTTVTYAEETGEIRDADIELNSASAMFTTGDGAVLVDLPSILTHETGHFLGLAHSPADGATMAAQYPPKSTSLRTLEADDVAGICDAYPPESLRPCQPTPVNGLGDTCDEPAPPPEETGCEISRGSATPGAWLLSGAALLAAAALRRSRTGVFSPRPRTM